MKSKPTINIYGVDEFFKHGVERILTDIFLNIPSEQKKVLPQIDIWVLSQKCLTDVLPFVTRPAPAIPSVVFCSARCQRLLRGIPNDWNICLFDLNTPIAKIKQQLPKRLATRLLTGRFDNHQSSQPRLSHGEQETMRHLSMGFSPHRIAQLTHKSVKTISTHKRNSMKRLGVFSSQELMIKVKIIGLH